MPAQRSNLVDNAATWLEIAASPYGLLAMIMRSNLEFAASAIVMLLVTIGPLETAAIFGVLTSGARRAARRRLAVEAVAIAGVVLVVFAIGGPDFLRLLHVSIPAFQVAAGILLLLQSIELLFAHPRVFRHSPQARRKKPEPPVKSQFSRLPFH